MSGRVDGDDPYAEAVGKIGANPRIVSGAATGTVPAEDGRSGRGSPRPSEDAAAAEHHRQSRPANFRATERPSRPEGRAAESARARRGRAGARRPAAG